jgi:subtilisin family serine protease
MKTIRLILLLFFIGIPAGWAADSVPTAHKISPFFQRLLNKSTIPGQRPGFSKLSAAPIIRSSGDTLYQAIIRTTDPQALRSMGIQINSVCKNFVTAHVTTAQVRQMSGSSLVTFIREARKRHPNNDVAAGLIGARSVQNGAINNTKYTGKGVLICDIDTGIDWKHLDFRDPDDTTKSRIVYIWDQTLLATGSETDVKGYGVLYTQSQINNELGGSLPHFVRTADNDGHGTHVSGTIAGNGASMKPSYKYAGMAPQADIIMVETDYYDSSIIDAIEWADSMATVLGKPLVINLSLGTVLSAHDGTADDELVVDDVCAKPGRVVAISAGNSELDYIHVSGTMAAHDSATINFTVPSYTASSVYGDDYILVDTWMNSGTSVTGFLQSPNKKTVTAPPDTIFVNMSSDGYMELYNYISPNNGKLEIEAYISNDYGLSPKSGTWIMKLYNSSSAPVTYHGWFQSSLGASGSTVRAVSGDNNYVVGTPGNASAAITAAAYTSRWYWKSLDGNTYSSTYANSSDNIAAFSSAGPRVDNFQKPDIAAPGFWLVSVFPNSSLSAASASNIQNVTPDGKHQTMAGTSMASPCVAGSCALLLQYNPNLTAAQIKNAIISTATADAFTGSSLPTPLWGYGKLDVLKALSLLASVSTSPGRTMLAYDQWTGSSGSNYFFAASSEKYAVRITPSSNGTLSGVFFHPASKLKFSGSPSIEIWTDNGSGLPANRMAGPFAVDTSGILASSWNYYDLSTQTIPVSSGTNYHVVLYGSAGISDTLTILYDARTIDGRTSKYSGGTWVQVTNGDARMRAVITDASTSVSAVLSSFTATAGSGTILLQWTSSSETDVYAYRIQSMSPDSSHWTTIGSVYGHGTNSSSHSYSFTDSTVSASGTYTYRLAEMDSIGSVVYSSIVQVLYSKPAKFAVFQNFPNPFTSTTTIIYDIAEQNHTTVRVYDILGRVIITLADEIAVPKTYTLTFNASKLAAGVYFYKVTSGGNTAVKKMIVLH